MTTRLRPHLDKLLLALIFIVLSASTIAWTLKDRTPPPWDPSDHLRYAYDYHRLLAHGDLAGFAREFFTVPHFYAPFVHLVTAAMFLVFGASRVSGIAVNLLSLAAILWAVVSISRRLYGGAPRDFATPPGPVSLWVLPALIASCYHFSAWLIHDAFVDFPLIAAVTVAAALLIRAEDFRVRRYALEFAAAAGVGMLVKQTFAFFFIGPAIYVAVRVLLTRDRRAILNLVLAAAVLILISAVWYAPHLRDVIAIFRENQRAAVSENEARLFSFDSNFFYIHALISMQMQLPLALLFVAGLVYSLIRRRKQSVILYLWLASGLAAFAFVANKDVRYTAPVLPAAAILSVCWLGEAAKSAPARVLKAALAAVIAVWSLVSFFNAQWPKPGFGTAIDTPRYRWMVFARNYYGYDHRPLDDDWGVPEIVQTISQIHGQRGEQITAGANLSQSGLAASDARPVAGVVVNLPYLNPSSIALFARLLASGRAAPPLMDVRWITEPSMLDRIAECDYLVVRTGLDQADWVASVEPQIEKMIRESPNRFARVASFPIPMKGAEAVVYRLERH